ncbi:phosphatidate cytidyltransferase [Klebsormidium nitens]|uniref:phytol kinase n=1 Tax=Klebsormidium nitens TaxID=105231 RepID=A0A1Y1I8C9_KLENI|nr:phosphatidate cytidyltransferase [Klebsormidium nitens]|eukprot:GAQ87234.1 phosphatidate cytidyltransferase [Klebsormidium nitens]
MFRVQRLSRKVIHIGTGPIFLLTWNLFSDAPESRYFAAAAPLLVTANFFLLGIGVIRDPRAVASMSRRGDPAEMLRGPLYYGIVFLVATTFSHPSPPFVCDLSLVMLRSTCNSWRLQTSLKIANAPWQLVFWRNSPLGVLGLSALCGGDGLAEVLGRRYGRAKLPWSQSKTYVGSSAMFLGSFVFGLAALVYFNYRGNFDRELSLCGAALFVCVLSFAAAAVESFPYRDVDNITVPLAVVVLGHWLLPLAESRGTLAPKDQTHLPKLGVQPAVLQPDAHQAVHEAPDQFRQSRQRKRPPLHRCSFSFGRSSGYNPTAWKMTPIKSPPAALAAVPRGHTPPLVPVGITCVIELP